MVSFAATVLSPEQRVALAADPGVGGGNLLRSALAASPHPDEPFIYSATALPTTDHRLVHHLSLNDLDQLAQSWSAWYVEQGVRPRDRVAVFLADSFAYSLHFYALAQIGAVAVLINSNASRAISESLIEQTRPVGLYTDRTRLTLLDRTAPELASLCWTRTVEELPAPPARALDEHSWYRHDQEDPVAILHSSGTTGRPKPTIHTHRSIVSGPKFRLVDHTETPGALMLTSLPQSHLGCIAYTAYAVLGGTPLVALRDSTGAELAAAVAEHRPTAVMSFAHGYAELAALDVRPGDLDSVNVWISIGDAVHQAHITRVLAQRSAGLPPAAFYDRLGTTELGWGVLLQVRTLASERKDRCAGRPVGVAEVAVLRPDGTPAAPGEVGLLGARGPAITPGYWNDSATTHASRLAGYWLTGDMALRDENGDHYLVDRAADAIPTSSGMGYSVAMEEVLLASLAQVSDCAVVAGRYGEEVVPVAVVTTHTGDVDAGLLMAGANDALRAAGHPELALLEVARTEQDFPLGVTGKVLKRQLRERYDALGTYLAGAGSRHRATAPALVP
ncbi:MAG: acyl--CoA ligase [Actinobacteria bacterium]|nr:acyl--CoA ligase [Actinomycetota bacterium]